jgi:hypothetical protein
MSRLLASAGVGLAASVLLLLQSPPGPRVWAQTADASSTATGCANCHAGVSEMYAHAGMQHALQTPGVDPVLKDHQNLSAQVGSYSYAVQTNNGRSTYSVSDGAGSLTLPIRWTFGQNNQTWVLEKDGEYYESQVSYFRREQGLATTPGDGSLAPHNLSEAIGRKVSVWELLQCFNCHATGATAGERLTLDKLRPGVGCERCHDGAEQHQADVLRNNLATVPASLKTMSAEDAENFCGKCHRTWQSAVRNHWHGPADVRFQPYRLANSRCFIGNDRRISCMACHDPHQPVNEDAAFYDSKCLACHAESNKSTNSFPVQTCKVSKKNCVSCHMPKVELPGGHAAFTDHMIRIVRAGDAYPD